MQLQTSQTLQKEAAWKDDKTKTFDSVSQTITRSTEGYNFPPVSKKEGWGDKASVSALPPLLQFPLGPSGSCIWAPGSSCLTWICSETGREHPELFLQLERWHSLLRLGAPLLPWRVWVFNPQPLQAQRKLPAGFQHCRVSSYSFYDSFSYSFVLFFLFYEGWGRNLPGICTRTEWFHGSTCQDLSVRLALCPQEAGRLPPSAGPRRPGEDEWARLEVRLHVHPRVLPLPGGERPGQNKKAILGTFRWFHTQFCPCRNVSRGQGQTLGTFLNIDNFLRQTADAGVLAVTYGCLCALSGHLAPRISAFHWDYTSVIPVRAIKIWGLISSGCLAV